MSSKQFGMRVDGDASQLIANDYITEREIKENIQNEIWLRGDARILLMVYLIR